MPRKSYKSKSYKGKGRTTYRKTKYSKYNLYKYRSSKAQAKQIYDLNKKVTSMYKSIKPDTNTMTKTLAPSASINFGAGSVVNYAMGQFELIGNDFLNDVNQLLAANIDYVYVKNIKFYFNYRYTQLSGTSQPIYVRLTAVQLKTNGLFPTPANVYNDLADPYLRVKGPLKATIVRSGYKIAYDKTYKLTNEYPNLDIKLNFYVGRFEKSLNNFPAKAMAMYVYVFNPNYSNAVNYTDSKCFVKYVYNSHDTVANS